MSPLGKIEMSSFAKLTSKGGYDGKGDYKNDKKEFKRLEVIHKDFIFAMKLVNLIKDKDNEYSLVIGIL